MSSSPKMCRKIRNQCIEISIYTKDSRLQWQRSTFRDIFTYTQSLCLILQFAYEKGQLHTFSRPVCSAFFFFFFFVLLKHKLWFSKTNSLNQSLFWQTLNCCHLVRHNFQFLFKFFSKSSKQILTQW